MRLITAVLLPSAAFFAMGRSLSGILCLLLQLTLIGWLPAALWALHAQSQYDTDQKIHRAVVRLS